MLIKLKALNEVDRTEHFVFRFQSNLINFDLPH